MGESPPANVIKRKRSHDSDSSMANGGRADEKDAGQLPSPVSGTGGPDAGKAKDGRTKADTDGPGKGKRPGGRSSGKNSSDDRSAGSRAELRKPEVEGSDRSERGLLLEVRPPLLALASSVHPPWCFHRDWYADALPSLVDQWWTIFNDFRQIQTSATLAVHPPVDDAEAYLSSFSMTNAHGSVPPGSIARVGVFPGGRGGSMNGGPGRVGLHGNYGACPPAAWAQTLPACIPDADVRAHCRSLQLPAATEWTAEARRLPLVQRAI
jgi:hypothetical protein